MKPQALLIMLAVVAALATLPLAESKGRPKAAAWPCCDECGVCNRKFPPDCYCEDASPIGCHPECENCVKSIGSNPVFQCKDLITNFCERRCTPAAELGEEE